MSAMEMNGILGSAKARKVIFSFATPAETEKITYTVKQQHLVSALQRHPWFHNGVLIKTMEKGVMYPVMHFVTAPYNQQESTTQLLNSSSLGSNYILQQGVYTEIKQFRPFPENELLEDDDNASRAYIVIGFKTLESTFNETLEEMWKDWTGARSIYLNLPDELGLSQVSFYRRTVPKGTNMFMYILVVQCENVSKKNCWMLLDYVQRLRVEKMMGYMSTYHRVDDETNFSPTLSHLNAMANNEVNGLMPVDI